MVTNPRYRIPRGTPRPIEPTEPVVASRRLSAFAVVSTLMLIVCYWAIDHEWDRSRYLSNIDDSVYSGNENVTADRLNTVNAKSTIARLVLGAWGIFCVYHAGKLRFRWESPLLWSMIAIGLMLSASLLWSTHPKLTLFKLVVLGTVGFTAIGIASKVTLDEFLTIVTIVCVSFIGIGVVAEAAQGTLRLSSSYRFIGTAHPNTQAIYAAMLCLIARQFFRGRGESNLWGITILVCGIVVILLTKSRTTLGAVAAGVIITQFVLAKGATRLLLAGGAVGCIGFGLVASTLLSQRTLGALGNVAVMGRSEEVSSLTGRLPLWEELMTWINKSPVVGYGYLSFWDAKRVEYLSERLRWEIPHGHNIFIDTMLDIGYVGLGLLIACIVFGFAAAARRLQESGMAAYGTAIGIFTCAIVNGLAESLFKLPGFPLFVVLTCCCYLVIRSDASETEPVSDSLRPFGARSDQIRSPNRGLRRFPNGRPESNGRRKSNRSPATSTFT